MAETFRVKDLSEALELAENFKSSGKYNLFRGQGKNWQVKSTIGRLTPEAYEEIKDKTTRLYSFFKTEPILQKFTTNIDWFFAVAQHYGLPTNYIDFTSDVEVATYFATNSNSNSIGEDCAIICLNENEFSRFVKFSNSLYQQQKVISPYIIRINVDNLWRLHAQKGCFMFFPFSNVETFYDFDKIIFPFTTKFDKLTKEDIYPTRKSELEIYLDHYFNAEERMEGAKRFNRFSEELKIPITTLGPIDISAYIKNNKPNISWNSKHFTDWQYPIKEEWVKHENTKTIRLHFPHKDTLETQISKITNEIEIYFIENEIRRNTPLFFEIIARPRLTKYLGTIINRSCARIWDGTRNLPYSDSEIISIISKYICLEIYENKFHETLTISGQKIIALELTNEYGSITRCWASESKIVEAFRDDLDEVLIDSLLNYINSEILLRINVPNIIFDFHKLLRLFIDEIVIYQVLYNSEKENPVIFYTPTQVTIMGYP